MEAESLSDDQRVDDSDLSEEQWPSIKSSAPVIGSRLSSLCEQFDESLTGKLDPINQYGDGWSSPKPSGLNFFDDDSSSMRRQLFFPIPASVRAHQHMEQLNLIRCTLLRVINLTVKPIKRRIRFRCSVRRIYS